MTDRPTDRPTEPESAHRWWKSRYDRLCGLGEYAKTNKGVEHPETTLNNNADIVWQAIQHAAQSGIGGVEPSEISRTSQESEVLKALLSQDYGKTTHNLRVQRLMGINSKQGVNYPITKETIPSEKDRSMFSCERYQFFLDADFEIGQQCCNVMKKEPANRYKRETGRVPITAMMASESRLRTQKWLKQGCNAFDAKKPMSMPMAFWTEQDVLLYIYQNKIPIASVYGEVIKENEVDGQIDMADLGLFDLGIPTLKTTGCQRTGCVFCGFGAHREKEGEGRFERLKITHPHLYEYIMKPKEEGGLNYKEIIDWINEHGDLNIKY